STLAEDKNRSITGSRVAHTGMKSAHCRAVTGPFVFPAQFLVQEHSALFKIGDVFAPCNHRSNGCGTDLYAFRLLSDGLGIHPGAFKVDSSTHPVRHDHRSAHNLRAI